MLLALSTYALSYIYIDIIFVFVNTIIRKAVLGRPRYVLYVGMYVYFFLELIILPIILSIGYLCNIHWDKELIIGLQPMIMEHIIIMDYIPCTMEPEFFKTSFIVE